MIGDSRYVQQAHAVMLFKQHHRSAHERQNTAAASHSSMNDSIVKYLFRVKIYYRITLSAYECSEYLVNETCLVFLVAPESYFLHLPQNKAVSLVSLSHKEEGANRSRLSVRDT